MHCCEMVSGFAQLTARVSELQEALAEASSQLVAARGSIQDAASDLNEAGEALHLLESLSYFLSLCVCSGRCSQEVQELKGKLREANDKASSPDFAIC